MSDMRQVVLDTETTGRQPGDDRVVEIGCVELVNRTPTGKTYHVYINPERPMPEDAFKIHGLSDEFLKDKPVFKEIIGEFMDFVRGSELIIHNAPFDMAFLNMEFGKAGEKPLDGMVSGVTDTVMMAREYFPGRHVGLDILCDRFDINRSHRTLHGALLDAELLRDVYLAMTREQKTFDIDSLAEAAENDSAAMRDMSSFRLKVIKASDEETAAHEAVLDSIEKQNKGKPCVYRAEAAGKQA